MDILVESGPPFAHERRKFRKIFEFLSDQVNNTIKLNEEAW